MARKSIKEQVVFFSTNHEWEASCLRSGSGWTITLKNLSAFGCHFIIAGYKLIPSLDEISDPNEPLKGSLNYVSDALVDVGGSAVLHLTVTKENGESLLQKARLEIAFHKAWGNENTGWIRIALPPAH